MACPQSSSDAILDSLFDDIAKGKVSFDGPEGLLPSVSAPAPSLGDLPDQPTTSQTAEPETIIPPIRNEENDDQDTVFATTEVKPPESKRSAIKIASLKETTKSRIIVSQEGENREKGGKLGEEGEILPSDAGSDASETEGEETQQINESDGELAPSDAEKKPSKKRKKKKHEHRRHKHKKHPHGDRHKSRKKKSDSKKATEAGVKKSEKDKERSGRQKSTVKENDERRPWKKMLDFHLNANLREEGRYRSLNRDHLRTPLPNRRDQRSSLSTFGEGYPSRRKSDCMNTENYRGRRFSRSPLSRNSRVYGGEEIYWRYSPCWSNSELQSSRKRGFSRERSPIRSKHRSPRKERVPLDTATFPDKPSEKSAVPTSAEDGRIDKQKLYEIARRNAAAMLRSGVLQKHLSTMSTEELMKLRTGGKSMEDLIEYCRKIQEKDKTRDGDAASSSEDEERTKMDEDELDSFVRHPFLLKQQANSFVFNVKNVIQIPVKTPAERVADDAKLRITYPVSSGEQHKTNDSAWVPVSPPPSGKTKSSVPKATKNGVTAVSEGTSAIPALPPPPSPPSLDFVPPPPPQPQHQQAPIDIGEVVSSRLKAICRLNDNPNDVEAMKLLHFADEQLKQWAESKNMPGLFVGSTGVECLTAEQLAPSDYRFHAWAKKDCLTSAKPVTGGVGMQLMQKMGWRPGEGLGKNREGTLEPLQLEVKSDRKGLLASEEGPNQRVRSVAASFKDLQGKHPVSALMELCSKRRWNPPSFSCNEAGPSHDRRFNWKALVNGIEYQTATPASNKKSGKAQVCQVVLQSLGLVPRDKSLPVVIG